MSLDDEEKPVERLRMMLIREGSTEYAVALGRGLRIVADEDDATLFIGTHGTDYEEYSLEADPKKMEPHDPTMSLLDKLTLRFTVAAARGTNVDLRFCSGSEKLRKPEQDNLRKDYGYKP